MNHLNHEGGRKCRRDKIIAAFIRHLERIYELGGAKSLFLRRRELWARFFGGTIMSYVRGRRATQMRFSFYFARNKVCQRVLSY